MTPDNPYHLNEIGLTLRRRRRFLRYMTLAAVLAGVLLHFLLPASYGAETRFILKNPRYADRSNIYNDARQTDYFAGEEDAERLIAMAGSDSVKDRIIRDMRLDAAYHYHLTDETDRFRLQKTFSNRLRLLRAEDNSILLSYTDGNAERAARVANYTVQVLDQSYRGYFNEMWQGMYGSLQVRIAEQDSAIGALTDTLVRLREQYHIYDIISPSRHNLMVGPLKGSGAPDYARGLELVQNTESVKDELVSSRATNITLLSQYTTGADLRERPLITVLTAATPHMGRSGVGLVGMILISGFAGLLFGILYSLAAARFFAPHNAG